MADKKEKKTVEVNEESLRTTIREELVAELRSENEIELTKLKDELRVQNDAAMQQAILNWQEQQKKAAKPLTPAEIQKLLDQEYAEFSVTLPYNGESKKFTIVELPQEQERQFYKLIKENLAKAMQAINGDAMRALIASEDRFQRIVSYMTAFSEVFDLMAEACVICLNPRKEVPWLTEEWVGKNLSSYRIFSIIKAQLEANKIRDFFLLLFQDYQSVQ